MSIKPTELVRRVALYRSPYDNLLLCEAPKDPDRLFLDGYVRVSEVLKVTVVPLSPGEITAGHLRVLYGLRAVAEREATKKLADIDARIANLRALPEPSND